MENKNEEFLDINSYEEIEENEQTQRLLLLQPQTGPTRLESLHLD